VGRDRELAEIAVLLRRKANRLLTLTGPAGAGKTRLALEYARRRGSGEASVLVELADVAEDADPTQAVAAALGAGQGGTRMGVETLIHTLTGRRVLLLMDNCEHVVEACARLLGTLLQRCPGLRVLATSREALRIPGEVVLRIGALDQAPRTDGMTGSGTTIQVADSDAVRLFVERASASVPGFTAVGDDAATIAEICRRLDGMPLAIELAARRVVSLPLHAIMSGLDNQLALLTGGSRTGPARHLGLAAAIDWSHRLLDEPARTMLRRVALLPGGFDADAVTAVAADNPTGALPPGRILSVLLELEAKSLVVRAPGEGPAAAASPTPPGLASSRSIERRAGSVRFRLLETVRAYAHEKLEEAGETATTRRRTLAWLAKLVRQEPGLLCCGEHLPDHIAAERENIAAAVAGAPGDLPPVLTLAMARIRLEQGQLSAARAVLEENADWPDGYLQAARLAFTARTAVWQGDTSDAEESGEMAVDLARSLGHPALLAGALGARAGARLAKRKTAQAVDDMRARVTALVHLNRPIELAWAQQQLAWALLQAGCPAEADVLLAECLPVLRKYTSPPLLCPALHSAGAVRLRLQDWTAAQNLFVEALRTGPAEFQGVYAIEGLAAIAAEHGEYGRAARLFTAAAESRERHESVIAPGWQDQVAPFQDRAAEDLSSEAGPAALGHGRAFTWVELVAYALRGTRGHSAQRGPAGTLGQLTAREEEVAQLVARGLTDRQIGASLRVSPRTVATYLNRTRTKLGLRSRSEIAVWIVGQHITHA